MHSTQRFSILLPLLSLFMMPPLFSETARTIDPFWGTIQPSGEHARSGETITPENTSQQPTAASRPVAPEQVSVNFTESDYERFDRAIDPRSCCLATCECDFSSTLVVSCKASCTRRYGTGTLSDTGPGFCLRTSRICGRR